MSKARTQPSTKTGLVFKISAALFLLLAVVLYKLNDYFKQEKFFLAQSQLRSQIVSTKTAVSSQLNQLRNILSSFETELTESKINWVQLDPFFGIAKAQKSGSQYKITQFIGRSGSMGDRWNAAYLDKALSLRKSVGEAPITAQLFRDKQGGKYLAIGFTNARGPTLMVVGSADYFQKYFDLNRGGKITSLLKTTDNVLAGHSEGDYVATLTDEGALSEKKYLIEKEEINGTNLVAVNYVSKNSLASGFVIPWTVVGLIAGFGFILVGLLFYSLDPIERKVERYKMQEREQIFKETLQQSLKDVQPTVAVVAEKPSPEQPSSVREETVFDSTVSSSTLMAPLQQALFNLDRTFKLAGITVEKQIQTNLVYDIPYTNLIRAFENIFKNSIDAVREKTNKKIIVRAYDIEQNLSVIEIKDTGVGLSANTDIDQLWQPFYSTKSNHKGLGLTEALSMIRQAGGDLIIEKAQPEGVLVKMIMKKEAFKDVAAEKYEAETQTSYLNLESETEVEEVTQKIDLSASGELSLDLEKALSLDDLEMDPAPEVQSAMTSKKFNTAAKPSAAAIQKPDFAMKKKDFKVDDFVVNVRRPEKS